MFDSKQQTLIPPNHHSLKKRHWLFGSVVILVGSWITHSTTASISDDLTSQQSLSLKSSPFSPLINSGLLDDEMAIELTPIAVTPPTPVLVESIHTIKKGETLSVIFKKRGLDLVLPHNISQHEVAKKLTKLSIGKELIFRFNQEKQLKEISYPISSLKEMLVHIDGTQVVDAKIEDLPYITLKHDISAQINSSLYEAALDAGLSNNLVMEMVRIFGWDVDFAQDIRKGDAFHVIYTNYNLDGKVLSDGNILAAEFTTQNQTYRAIRFEDDSGNISFYTPEGKSMLGTFLRSPVEFSRISSRFGRRKHPILKTWKAHKGVDYAARRGTPIRATADGKVIHAGNKGSYGRAVVLRHAGRFSTLYAHMNGYAKGIRSGKRVKQGEVIGYIGSSGRATGPHLHYEFRVNGVHRNPLTYKTPKASSIVASSKEAFNALASEMIAKLESLSKSYQIAKLTAAERSTSQL